MHFPPPVKWTTTVFHALSTVARFRTTFIIVILSNTITVVSQSIEIDVGRVDDCAQVRHLCFVVYFSREGCGY